MNRRVYFRYLPFAALVFVLAFAFAAGSALAAEGPPALQEPEPPPVQVTPPVVEITPIIPETGDDTVVIVDNLFQNWVFWAIVILVLVALVVALVARGGGTHHHP